MTEKIKLGEHEVDVFPQRHAYLTNKLGKYVDRLAGSDLDFSDAAGVAVFLGSEAYDLLSVLLPQYGKRCPRYEFCGYGSQQALEAGEYQENADKSPTFEEIIEAFSVSARVQRFDTLKVLGKVVDPKLLRGWINARLAETLANSASLQSVKDGAPALTTSSAKSPTSTVSEDSPSRASNFSGEPTQDEPSENSSTSEM